LKTSPPYSICPFTGFWTIYTQDFSLARSLVQSSKTGANSARRSIYGGASEETFGEPEDGQPRALAEEDRQEQNAPDVDEDGWQTVKPRRKAASRPRNNS